MLDYSFYIPTPRLAIIYPNPSNETHVTFYLELYKNYTTVDEHGNTKYSVPDPAAATKLLQERAAQIESENSYGRYILAILPPESASDNDSLKRVQKAIPVGIATLNLRGPGTPPIPGKKAIPVKLIINSYLVDIGFSLLPSARGKGYATEAVEGLSGWFEREKGVTELLAYCDDDNKASMKVLERSGFESLGKRDFPTLMNSGSVGRTERPALMVYARGLKKELAEYGL